MNRKSFRVVVLSLSVVLMLSVVSCDPAAKMEKQEKEEIQTYLSKNSNLNFVKESSGLYYCEVTAGTGISAVIGDSAFVKYTGMFLDGSVFDSSITTGKPLAFILGEMVPGFNEGIQLMKTGGKSTLLIPSKLAYGQNGRYPYIAGYTPLLFDVELVRVVPQTAK
jgi:FKBP-type peptidyl-prolyl cis-trans isomerase FkpA